MGYMYRMEYYSYIKKKGILPFATTWMALEIIMLSEISQSEKDKIQHDLNIKRKHRIQIQITD